MKFYGQDRGLSSICIELNRRIYMAERTGRNAPDFDHVALPIRQACINGTSLALGLEQ